MDLRHVRTFVTVAEEGTVSKAALRLRIAQPALSRQIKDLEGELGITLFDRLRGRLVLTAAGERLLAECRNIIMSVTSLREQAEILRRPDAGVLKIGATPQMIDGIFSTFLHRYAARFPKVRIKVSEAVGPDLFAKLERGELHLGIGSVHAAQPGHGFASFPLPPVEFLAASHASQQLGSGGKIEIGALPAIHFCCWKPASQCATRSTQPVGSRGSVLRFSLKAAPRILSWHSPRPDMAWRSCLPSCPPAATGFASLASCTGAGRCGFH
jgi:DNA-binding transcriptional LysR family regulator